MFLASLAHATGPTVEVGFREFSPMGKQAARDEKGPIADDQAAQAGYGEELYAQSRGRTAEPLKYEMRSLLLSPRSG
jgi:hypothetical protein